MSQPIKVSNGTPDGSFSVIDNSAAPAISVLNAGAPIGYDTTAPGAIAQGTNVFSNGSVLLDSVNDTAPNTYDMATVVGNPVLNIAPIGKTLTTVLNNSTTGLRILLKNPG